MVKQHIRELTAIFRRKEEIVSSYLFGSVAEGVHTTRSDVDIAVLVKDGLGAMEKYRMRMDLVEWIEQALQHKADVIILNDASLKMQHQVFRRGKPIYIKNELMEEIFRLHSQKEYFDFQYYMEKERRDIRAFYDC